MCRHVKSKAASMASRLSCAKLDSCGTSVADCPDTSTRRRPTAATLLEAPPSTLGDYSSSSSLLHTVVGLCSRLCWPILARSPDCGSQRIRQRSRLCFSIWWLLHRHVARAFSAFLHTHRQGWKCEPAHAAAVARDVPGMSRDS